MSTKSLIEKNCDIFAENIGVDECTETNINIEKIFYMMGKNRILPASSMNYETLKTLARTPESGVYALPKAVEVVNYNQSEIIVNRNEFGFSAVNDEDTFFDFDYKMEASDCTLEKLKKISKQPVTFFMANAFKLRVEAFEKNGDVFVRGMNGKFGKKKGMHLQEGRANVETAFPHIKVIVDTDYTNTTLTLEKDLREIGGLNDVIINVTASTTESVTFTAKEACGLANIAGLVAGDLNIKDSNDDDVVITDLSENNGVYVATFTTQSAGSYSLNLANVVDQEPYFYAPQATATAFEIA